MFMGIKPLGILGKSKSITEFGYVTSTSDLTDGTDFSFSSVSFGAADATREIIVVASFYDDTDTASPSATGCTIGGETAVRDKSQGDFLFGRLKVEVWRATVPTGTSGTITIDSISQSVTWCAISVYRAVGGISEVYDSGSSDGVNGKVDSDTMQLRLNTLSKSAVIGMSAQVTGSTTTWLGLTEDVDLNITGSHYLSTASDFGVGVTTETNRQVEPTRDSTVDRWVGISISYN